VIARFTDDVGFYVAPIVRLEIFVPVRLADFLLIDAGIT
jgi:hypothetical protein